LFKLVLKSRSRILSVRLGPHPLTEARAVKKCSSGAKPDVQNRTIKKKQVLRSRIENSGENVDAAPEPPELHQNFNPNSEPGAAQT
jgi:hypothetical protein